MHRVVCPFTPQLPLVLINRPRRDDTLAWRWYTAAVGGIRTHDLVITSPAPYDTTSLKYETENIKTHNKKATTGECLPDSEYVKIVWREQFI